MLYSRVSLSLGHRVQGTRQGMLYSRVSLSSGYRAQGTRQGMLYSRVSLSTSTEASLRPTHSSRFSVFMSSGKRCTSSMATKDTQSKGTQRPTRGGSATVEGGRGSVWTRMQMTLASGAPAAWPQRTPSRMGQQRPGKDGRHTSATEHHFDWHTSYI